MCVVHLCMYVVSRVYNHFMCNLCVNLMTLPYVRRHRPTKSMAAMVTERQRRIQQKGKRRREDVSEEEEETEKTAKQQQPASGGLQPSSHE